jgi:hypothetical protein
VARIVAAHQPIGADRGKARLHAQRSNQVLVVMVFASVVVTFAFGEHAMFGVLAGEVLLLTAGSVVLLAWATVDPYHRRDRPSGPPIE